MAAQKNSIDYDLVITAHKFTCPYHSQKWEGLKKPMPCGANDIAHQPEGCSGDCWYMKHFKELLEDLLKD